MTTKTSIIQATALLLCPGTLLPGLIFKGTCCETKRAFGIVKIGSSSHTCVRVSHSCALPRSTTLTALDRFRFEII